MNIVFVKHGAASCEYAFSVPEPLVPYIKKDQEVYVETMRGLAPGRTTTGVISGPGALDFAVQRGAYEPLKPTVSFIPDGHNRVILDNCRFHVMKIFEEKLKEAGY